MIFDYLSTVPTGLVDLKVWTDNIFFIGKHLIVCTSSTDNLSRINVNSAPSLVEGRKAVANLLYWLKDEDSAIARKVEVFCNANVWDEELSGYIATIVKLQASKGVPYAL